jgi:hypothetical protein
MGIERERRAVREREGGSIKSMEPTGMRRHKLFEDSAPQAKLISGSFGKPFPGASPQCARKALRGSGSPSAIASSLPALAR